MSSFEIVLLTTGGLLTGVGIGLWIGRRYWARFTSVQNQLHAKQLEDSRREARTDALTGLTNRRGFDEIMRRRVGERQQRKSPVSLIVLDVDRFKTFNDEHGHHVGDDVLRSVGRILLEQLRETDTVARIGGDEFSVLLWTTDLDDAVSVSQRIRTTVAAHQMRVEGMLVRVSVSIGVAEVIPGETPESLFQRADAAVYASKQSGRNCVSRHDGHSAATTKPV